MSKNVTIKGIAVGSRREQQEMIAAIDANGIQADYRLNIPAGSDRGQGLGISFTKSLGKDSAGYPTRLVKFRIFTNCGNGPARSLAFPKEAARA
jgi:hypothetical protein